MLVLSEIFKECAQVEMIEVFVKNHDKMLYLTDIWKKTSLSKTTINKHIEKLLEDGIIDKKNKNGRIQYYQLNLNNPKVKILLRLEEVIASENLEDFFKNDMENDKNKNVPDVISVQTTLKLESKVNVTAIPKTSNFSKIESFSTTNINKSNKVKDK